VARRNDHTREQLRALALAAARRLLEKHGPAGLTTRAVAARMGYTVGSLYLVFRDREDMVWQINARTLDELYTAAQTALTPCRSPQEALTALARAYVKFAFEHQASWRLIFEQQLPASPSSGLQERAARMFALVEAQLHALGVRRAGEPLRFASHVLWSGVHGVCVLGLTGRLEENDLVSVQRLADSLVTNYLAGFVGKAARPKAKK